MADGASSSGSGPKEAFTTFELLEDGTSFAVHWADDENDDPADHGSAKHPVPEPEELPGLQQEERPAEQLHQYQYQQRMRRNLHIFLERKRQEQQLERPGEQSAQQQQDQGEHRAEDHEQQEQGQHPAQRQQVPQEQHDRQPAPVDRGQQARRELLAGFERRQLTIRQRPRQPLWPELPDPLPEGGEGTVVKNFALQGRFLVEWKEVVVEEDPNAGRELNPEPEPEPAPRRGPRGHLRPSGSRTTAVENREVKGREEIGEGRGGNECERHGQDSLLFGGSHPELFSWFMRLNFEVLP